MTSTTTSPSPTLVRDLTSGLVVFLVALPLCLGIALASNAPLFSGLVAGIVGGLVVGLLSGSHTSVSGPAAGLTAVVAAQIATLESFSAFLLAVLIAGVLQIGFGMTRGGAFAGFVPTSVIKGLLAAIGVILILKQIPHLLGRDTDPEGDMAFQQPDHENTFSEFGELLSGIHAGAALIGILSLVLLVVWDRFKLLKKSIIPAPLLVVMLGVGLNLLFRRIGDGWAIDTSHMVQVPVADSFAGFLGFLQTPDFSQWVNPAVYSAGLTIAVVASLETLLNLEAVDKIDPQQRSSPPSRELVAQGVGNVLCGLIGGLPVTSVVVRSSVNVNAGGQTKLAAIFHGVLLLVCIALLPGWLNMIPLSCLAAILLFTGIKLVNPALIKRMWDQGRYQFIPFIVTLVAIVVTDLLMGVVIGLAVSVGFILNSSVRRPVRRFVEKHVGGDVLRVELANQVSFLNRAALLRVLDGVPRGGQVLLDAHNTDYIDPDVLDLIREFSEHTGPARGIHVSLTGFRSKYLLEDHIEYVDHCTRDLQHSLTPAQVLQILQDGHQRFRTGQRLTRDLHRLVNATADGQHPIAVVLSCIDSRTPAELIFDLGMGDIFCVRMAGNVTSQKVLGSIEYACAVAGAKLVVVMGHTRCGAVTAAVDLMGAANKTGEVTHCQHLEPIITEIQQSVDGRATTMDKQAFVDSVARRNVLHSVDTILSDSNTLADLVDQGRIAVVGAMYDVVTGEVEMLTDVPSERRQPAEA